MNKLHYCVIGNIAKEHDADWITARVAYSEYLVKIPLSDFDNIAGNNKLVIVTKDALFDYGHAQPQTPHHLALLETPNNTNKLFRAIRGIDYPRFAGIIGRVVSTTGDVVSYEPIVADYPIPEEHGGGYTTGSTLVTLTEIVGHLVGVNEAELSKSVHVVSPKLYPEYDADWLYGNNLTVE